MDLYTDQQLAEKFGITVEHLHKLRIRHRWPCVKLGRFDVRFTAAHVEQIVAQHTEAPTKAAAVTTTKKVAGQTARSASRSRAG